MYRCWRGVGVLGLIVMMIFGGNSSWGQSFVQLSAPNIPSDTLSDSVAGRRKLPVWVPWATVIGVHTAMGIVLYVTWYRNYTLTRFHFFDDLGEWLQMDKVGHVYSGYWMAWEYRALFPDYPEFAPWFSVLSMSTIEILDGFAKKWGFSVWDMLSNMAGAALAYWQFRTGARYPILKWGWFPPSYPPDPDVQRRVRKLYGESLLIRLLKDYNAQSYWVAVPVRWAWRGAPSWLLVTLGYSADGVLGGFENVWTEDGRVYDYRWLPRTRQFFLSLDVDWRVFGEKQIFTFLNSVRVPFPGLEARVFEDGRVMWYLRWVVM